MAIRKRNQRENGTETEAEKASGTQRHTLSQRERTGEKEGQIDLQRDRDTGGASRINQKGISEEQGSMSKEARNTRKVHTPAGREIDRGHTK